MSTATAFELRAAGGACWWQDGPLAALPGFFHLFTTRRGGVSPAPYDSWNFGHGVGDERARVEENRRLLRELLPGRPPRLVLARQVHGNAVAVVTGPPAEPAGIEPPVADALLTDRPGLPLALQFADCIPVVGYDPATRTAAVIHAGWRGTAAAVTAAAIAAWGRAYGARPADLHLAIGPGIGRCCYHLPGDAIASLLATVPGTPPEALTGPRPGTENLAVDLAEINRRQALAAGVPPEQIRLSGVCTACEPLAFSYRRDGPASGRMIAVAMLVP